MIENKEIWLLAALFVGGYFIILGINGIRNGKIYIFDFLPELSAKRAGKAFLIIGVLFIISVFSYLISEILFVYICGIDFLLANIFLYIFNFINNRNRA